VNLLERATGELDHLSPAVTDLEPASITPARPEALTPKAVQAKGMIEQLVNYQARDSVKLQGHSRRLEVHFLRKLEGETAILERVSTK